MIIHSRQGWWKNSASEEYPKSYASLTWNTQGMWNFPSTFISTVRLFVLLMFIVVFKSAFKRYTSAYSGRCKKLAQGWFHPMLMSATKSYLMYLWPACDDSLLSPSLMRLDVSIRIERSNLFLLTLARIKITK